MIKNKYITILTYISFVLIILLINKVKTNNYLIENLKYLKSEYIFDKLNKADKEIFSKKGKIYIINLWASNCKPCIKEILALNKLYDTHKADNIKFIAISKFKNDSVDLKKLNINFKFEKYYHKSKLFDFLQNLNPNNKLVIPITIIINKKGEIEYYFEGYSENNIKVTENYLSAK